MRNRSRFVQPDNYNSDNRTFFKEETFLPTVKPKIPSLFPPKIIRQPPPRMEEDLTPKCPYYELPAGMMVPLVAIEECTFKALNESKLRIPAPGPPSEELLAAIDRFYNFHTGPDNPRDVEGWEAKGLLQYFVQKTQHRLKLEEKLKKEGKTLEDAITNRYVPPPPTSHNEENTREAQEAMGQKGRGALQAVPVVSSSSSSSSSRSSRSRSRSKSPKRIFRAVRSASPEERPSLDQQQQRPQPNSQEFPSKFRQYLLVISTN
uniref:DUF7819 domain-containing protein n=1 Tax=Ditylenchus dipsaci TaxID=166011 RepID=A0A915DM11_9BILA